MVPCGTFTKPVPKSLAQKNLESYRNHSIYLHCKLTGLYMFVLKVLCEQTFYENKEVKLEFVNCFNW